MSLVSCIRRGFLDRAHPCLGIPVDFILFALTLLGVALFHHHTLAGRADGLAAIIALQARLHRLQVSAPGSAASACTWQHEWVMLANLFLLLMGFALLSRHFEESRVPDEMPALLPDDWKGGFVLLVLVFVLSSFLDNIAAALIGGTMARHVFQGKVHIGYLAAIVAASNAGGSGSVVGDTTTTMMWIDGVSPLSVLEAYVAAIVAMLIFAVPAAMQQQRYSPIVKNPPRGIEIDVARVFIVAAILIAAIVANVVANLKFPAPARRVPVIGLAVWVGDPRRPLPCAAGLEGDAGDVQGHDLPAGARDCRFDDAGREAAGGLLADRARARLRVRGVRQHPAHRARVEAGRLRLGLPRLRRRLRRLDDLVRLVGGRGAGEHVSGGEVGRPLAPPRLAGCCRLCHGVFVMLVILAGTLTLPADRLGGRLGLLEKA